MRDGFTIVGVPPCGWISWGTVGEPFPRVCLPKQHPPERQGAAGGRVRTLSERGGGRFTISTSMLFLLRQGQLHGNRRKPCEGANRERWRQGSLRNACCRAGTNGCRRVLCVIFCLESIDHPTIDSYGGSCRGRRKRRRQIGHNIRDLFDTCRSLDDRSAAMLFDERRSQILNR